MRSTFSYFFVVVIFLVLGACQASQKKAEETDNNEEQVTKENEEAYQALVGYSGTYQIESGENEGLSSKLTLQYNNDKTFDFTWNFEVHSEETNCTGKLQGKILVDNTQHGFYQEGDCIVHFNFNGIYNGKFLVEIPPIEKSSCQTLQGECAFGGTYVMVE
ncbi:MAG: hypothetical protein NZM38_05775 [Cytophagales bacterium]|nr:hypothetical protein [Cytophagales bacterium]MDW8384264.1 hypothetical protein [Flammeovirgaceae bacterium]